MDDMLGQTAPGHIRHEVLAASDGDQLPLFGTTPYLNVSDAVKMQESRRFENEANPGIR
jgi:hypothetical protein